MKRLERQRHFEAHLLKSSIVSDPSKWKQSRGTGVSNSPTVVTLGLEVLDADLDTIDLKSTTQKLVENIDGFIFWGSLWIPPGYEVYLGVFIRRDREALIERLKAMSEAHKSTPSINALRNNNVAVLACRADKRLYLRNKGHWNECEDTSELEKYAEGIEADRVEYAVYHSSAGQVRSLSVGAFIAFLTELFPPNSVHEILPWRLSQDLSASFYTKPADLLPDQLHASISALGGFYSKSLVHEFHAALNHLDHKHFVILSGPSGFGKTGLVLRYSQAVHGISDPSVDDPFLFVCAVKPDWTDPSGLLGYYDALMSRYVVPPFLRAVLTALANPNAAIFVCIDEMNIARVEYYFADILSAVESRRAVSLHNNPQGYEGTNGEEIPYEVQVPPNLFVVGTINMDETTYRISDKVMDRANTITVGDVDVSGFTSQLKHRESQLESTIDKLSPVLERLVEALRTGESPIGYRIIEEMTRYVHFCSQRSIGGSIESVIDSQILQKVLVKLHGAERQRKMLEDLQLALEDYPRSLACITAMQRDLNDFGSF